jgi:hypothetical protein
VNYCSEEANIAPRDYSAWGMENVIVVQVAIIILAVICILVEGDEQC